MKSRLIASVAMSAAVILGATGCSMLAPQATTIQYSPGDGIDVSDAPGAPLLVRNALIVATPDGSVGNLVAGVVNTTSSPQVLTVQVGEGANQITERVLVRADAISSLGENVDPLRLDGLNVKPGADVPVYFQSGDGEGALADVPVLGGQEAYLKDLVPVVAGQ